MIREEWTFLWIIGEFMSWILLSAWMMLYCFLCYLKCHESFILDFDIYFSYPPFLRLIQEMWMWSLFVPNPLFPLRFQQFQPYVIRYVYRVANECFECNWASTTYMLRLLLLIPSKQLFKKKPLKNIQCAHKHFMYFIIILP